LRGRGHEIFKPSLFTAPLVAFPSPCGEEVMKYEKLKQLNVEWLTFPSPCGEEVMKFETIADKESDEGFPSPCGEEVMKSRLLRRYG